MGHQLDLWSEYDRAANADSQDWQPLTLPDADVSLHKYVWDQPTCDRLFAQLLTEINWRQETAYLFNKSIPLPRLTAWHGDAGKAYTYSGIEMRPQVWTATLLEIKSAVDTIASVNFNSVLLNLYRDGNDSVGWHSDAEPVLGRNPIIASVSFGATRRFSFKHRYRRDLKLIHLDLTHGSLLLMRGTTQHHWLHQVPKITKPVTARINLTFRIIY